MPNVIKAWLADNPVTTDDKKDKMFLVETGQTYELDDVINEMHNEETGLRVETISHVVKLFIRIVIRLLLNGNKVNASLFYAVARLRGTAEKGQWNPLKNSIYVLLTQGAELREAIKETTVEILGEKSNVMYITEVEDRDTGLNDGTITPGRNAFIRGASLKVAGDDPSVGITLTPASGGSETKLAEKDITINSPTEMVIIVPSGLEDGTYTLTITTQYVKGSKLLKTPRSVSTTVYVGSASPGGNDDEEEDGPQVQ